MKETRKSMLAKRGRTIAQPEVALLLPPPPAASTLTQTRHIRCPCCGLQARVEPDPPPLSRALPNLREGPYMPEARMVTWGGSRPKDMPGQRVRANVDWPTPEPCTPEELQMLSEKLQGALAIVESISQEIEGGAREPSRRRRSTRTTKEKA